MLNLTTRLNERDENILRLQEEIDAYDAHVQMLEDAMECAAPTVSTKLEAEEYLAKLRRGRGNDIRYASENDPNHLLSAEEKVVELLMLKGRSNEESGTAWERSDDRRELETLLKDRVDLAAKTHGEARLTMLFKELESTRAKLQASEERRRTLEYSLELGAMSNEDQGSNSEKLQRYLERELAVFKEPYEIRLRDLTKELEIERDQRRRLTKELDQFKFEVGHVKTLVDRSTADEMSRLYHAIEQIEESVHSELLRNWTGAPASPAAAPSFADPNSASLSRNNSAKEAAKIAQLEGQLESLKRQHAAVRAELSSELEAKEALIRRLREETPSTAARDKEISQLKKAVATHVKDRRALKSILESRIRGKLDNIASLIAGLDAPERSQLNTEISSLQSLVNASVAAMESDT